MFLRRFLPHAAKTPYAQHALCAAFAASLFLSYGVPLPQATNCRLQGLSSQTIRNCCANYGIGCDSILLAGDKKPKILHVDVGHGPGSERVTVRLGGDCSGRNVQCSRGLKCKDGLCRKVGLSPQQLQLRKSVETLKGNIPSFVAAEKVAAPGSTIGLADSETENAGSATVPDGNSRRLEDGFTVSGLSVPLSHRVPMNQATSGNAGLLPPVRQQMRQHIDVVDTNVESNRDNENVAQRNATCPDNNGHNGTREPGSMTNTTGAGIPASAIRNSVDDDDSLGEASVETAATSDSGTSEETEDEQIADSVASVVEEMTGVSVDGKLLSAIDSAVTEAMDKYEDKAIAQGDLLIDVENLVKGEGTVEVKMKQTEPAGSEEGKEGQLSKPSLDPVERARLLSSQIYSVLRQKVEKNMAPEFIDKITAALMDPRCSDSGNASLGYSASNSDDRDGAGVSCEVVTWLRQNWFDKGQINASGKEV